MADIIKVFYEIGKTFQDERVKDYNDIFNNKIDKFIVFDIESSEYSIVDFSAISNRLITVSTSSKGGYLLPNLPLFDKNGLKAVWSNMEKYFSSNKNRAAIQKKALEDIKSKVDYEKIEEIKNEIKKIESVKKRKDRNIYYLALKCKERFISERFKSLYFNYLNSSFGESNKNCDSFIGNVKKSGADAGLNFCSVNELPKRLQKITKYRLLPLDKDSAIKVAHGFKRVFEREEFRFNLFGLTYYLLPTIFFKDKKKFFAELKRASQDENNLKSKVILEYRLERLVKRLEESDISQKVLFTFLFAQKNNNEIKLFQTIEDVAPSRITKAANSMAKFHIDSSTLSKYIKKSDYEAKNVYVKDYIYDSLFLAKLILGKERINSIDDIYHIVDNKILFGSQGWEYDFKKKTYKSTKKQRSFSTILSGNTFYDKANEIFYSSDDTNFKKHQRFLNFLDDIDALRFDIKNLIYGGDMEEFNSFEELANKKFENVELLKNIRAREFYIVGALARFVISWQHRENSDTVAKYIDSIGSITPQNIDRVFRKIYDGSRKYGMYGKDFDSLLTLYSKIKSEIKQSDNISIDKANIAFVMGNIDYKNFKIKQSEENRK